MSPLQAAVFNPETFTLDNGLQVVVVEKARAPIVVQMVWYKVGAADEPPGKSGIAHFLEHLMFKGTPSVPSGEFSKIVAANGGSDNAFTSQDYTAYVQRVASDKLELVMRMEADRMANLLLTDDKVAPERSVVQEERRQRTDNSPSAQLYERRRAVTYLRHPLSANPVIGWRREIDGLTTEDALAFYRRHYAPDNAVLIVSGDVTAAEVRRLAEKYYGPIPRRSVPERVRPAEPDQLAAKRVTMKSPRVHVPSVAITWRAPSYAAGEIRHAYPLLVLSDILGGGGTSRLHRRLVIEEKAASGAGAGYLGTALDMGEFSISASALAGGDIVKARSTAEGGDRARRRTRGHRSRAGAQQAGDAGGRDLCPRRSARRASRDRPGAHDRPDGRRCRGLAGADRGDYGRRGAGRRPGGLRGTAFGHRRPAPRVFRVGRRSMRNGIRACVGALIVACAAVSPATATEIQRVRSPGGIEAWLVEDKSVPVISFRFSFRGGGVLDPGGKTGLANMVSALLDEGADDLDSQAFQVALDDIAASDRLRRRSGALSRHAPDAERTPDARLRFAPESAHRSAFRHGARRTHPPPDRRRNRKRQGQPPEDRGAHMVPPRVRRPSLRQTAGRDAADRGRDRRRGHEGLRPRAPGP